MYSLTYPIDLHHARFYDGQNDKAGPRNRASDTVTARYRYIYQLLNSGVHSSKVSIRQRHTVKMTWLKKASAVRDWMDNLKKKEQSIHVSILNKKRKVTLLQNKIESQVRLLESVRKEIAEVSRHSNRVPSNNNQYNILAKCLVCDKVLIKMQKNCAWRKCERCNMWECGVCVRNRKHACINAIHELPQQHHNHHQHHHHHQQCQQQHQQQQQQQQEPEQPNTQAGDFEYIGLYSVNEEEEEEEYIL